MKITPGDNKPNLPRRLFWEYRFDDINWVKEADSIIDRVIERGKETEWDELIRFYGRKKVFHSLKSKITHLPDEVIADVCRHFNLQPQELLCYIRKQSTPQRWN